MQTDTLLENKHQDTLREVYTEYIEVYLYVVKSQLIFT